MLLMGAERAELLKEWAAKEIAELIVWAKPTSRRLSSSENNEELAAGGEQDEDDVNLNLNGEISESEISPE